MARVPNGPVKIEIHGEKDENVCVWHGSEEQLRALIAAINFDYVQRVLVYQRRGGG